jgi:hypothetical protein
MYFDPSFTLTNSLPRRFMRYNSFEDIEDAEHTLPTTWFMSSRLPTPELASVDYQHSDALKISPINTPSSRLNAPPHLRNAASFDDSEILSRTHRRGRRWSAEEDATLIELVETYGKDWKTLAAKFPGKTCKQIKERWSNQLSPTIVDTPWSVDEDFKLVVLVRLHGRSWCRITKELPGRTELMLKNRFHSFLRKKLGPEVFEQPAFDQQYIRGRLEKLVRRSLVGDEKTVTHAHVHFTNLSVI